VSTRWVSRRAARLRTAGALALALVLLSSAPAAARDLSQLPRERLERLELAAEIDALRREDGSSWPARYLPYLTALVAVGGVVVTAWKQASDLGAQRQRDREQRELESDRRLEDRFATLLSDLGAEASATRAGAAASLVTYLDRRYERFHHQIRIAVLTNLKLRHEEAIRKLLARVYVAAMRDGERANTFEHDLARACLANTDLSGMELREAELARADLGNALLLGVDMYRARGIEVCLEGARLCPLDGRPASLIEVRFRGARGRYADFSDAVLVNAHLDEADLRGASFRGAHLQAAHLRDARLEDATFVQANLADAYFWGARMNFETMRSITRAYNWRKAHFDEDVLDRLRRIARQGA
jgi:uncharacterized protein YjbI with pentapeptide repeats